MPHAIADDIFDTHKEPDEVFLPLDEERACEFYAMEMADFRDDQPFYAERITVPGPLLELGCGNGRLCRLLAAAGADVTGIDLSRTMLQLARQAGPSTISYLQMDMTALAFRRCFDRVIIPYHTLNLLLTPERITTCLEQIRAALNPAGALLLQLFVPDQTLLNLDGKRLFQFQIFEQEDGGRIIKETRRALNGSQLILEERYRLRPRQPGAPKEDLSHTLHLAAFPLERWHTLFHDAGLRITEQYEGYSLLPVIPGQDSCIFIQAVPR